MAETRLILPLVKEEIAALKSFEGFMRRRCQFSCCLHHVTPTKLVIRVKLEQRTYADSDIAHEPCVDCPERISGLQALLEGTPPPPERKLMWQCAFEELLDGTRDGPIPILGD